MTLTPGQDPAEASRQRTRDQVRLLRAASGDTLIVDTDDPADHGFICDSEHVLLPPAIPGRAPEEDPAAQLTAYLDRRGDDFEPRTEEPEETPTGRTRRFRVPRRRVSVAGGRDLLVTLDELDREFGVGVFRPDHLVHICPKASL